MNKKPNIIYILADDMGYGDVSCLNANSKIRTAQLDRVAAEGMVFRDAHASSAVCTPSRYSILTGRYNWRSWLKEGVTFGYSKPLIERDRMTVASLLKNHGYTTACVGKWHLGWRWAMKGEHETDVDYAKPIADGPTQAGFDYFFGISASLDMPPYVYVENDRPTAVPDRVIPESTGKMSWREGPIAPDFKHADALPTFTEKAIAFIEQSAKRRSPFFLYFPLPAPHTPILPSAAFQGKSGTNEYGDFCLQVDDVVGRIAETLKPHGLADNTILIFTSDNGCSPRADFEELAKCGHHPSHVFRGHKADIYEGGHRIPLLVRWPKEIAAGTASDETVCLSDLLATCADILGMSLPDDAGEDSISNLSAWRGQKRETSLREATVHHSIDGSFSIRRGNWKLEMCPGSGGWSHPRPGKECEGLPPFQFYDLSTDISERRNVYAEHPAVVAELKSLLTRYVQNGRSTPGAKQGNAGGIEWKQLWWMLTLAGSVRANENMAPDKTVTYKKLGGVELKLHVFSPKAHPLTDKRPVIVFFFGGGWNSGSPSQFYPHCKYFASRGMVAMSAEYRVRSIHGTSPCECVKDGKSAIRWIRQHANELGIDPDKLTAGGGSAGGHVAAAAGTTEGFNEEDEDQSISCRPNALVLFNPVFDNGPTGYGYDQTKAYWKEFSPMHNIGRDTPPTIVFLGARDNHIPVKTAEEYKKRMTDKGRRCDLHLYKDQVHGFFNFKNTKYFTETVIEADRFLVSLGYLAVEPTLRNKPDAARDFPLNDNHPGTEIR